MTTQRTGYAEKDLMIEVPMAEKDQAKQLGAKPLYKERRFISWYIPKGKPVEPFSRWIPEDPADNSMTLSQLLGSVRRVIGAGMPGRYWVKAEILNVSFTRHVYLELSDSDDSGQEKAKARASIWASRKHIIEDFEKETGQSLVPGTRVLIQVEVEYHERFGLGLIVQAIDPKFTAGEMALRVAKIRGELIKEGIYDLNKSLSPPKDFSKVIVVAPEQAAGLGDFRTIADRLQSLGICEFKYIHGAFQGDGAMEGLSGLLMKIAEDFTRESSFNVDAVVVIRGGGDKAGLYQLNHKELARRVCTMPFPVIVGVGHERDQTILDEVANQSCATPSMVAQYISGTIVTNVQQAKENHLVLAKYSERLIAFARQNAQEEFNLMREYSKDRLSEAKMACEISESDIQNSLKTQIQKAKNTIKELVSTILYQDPMRIMGRGYLVAKSDDGRVVPDQNQLQAGQRLTLLFRDGERTTEIKS